MKNNKNKGISLMVLVITIIVVLVIAGAIILGLSQSNPIEKASKATYLSDVNNFKTELNLYETKQFTDKLGAYNTTLLQADESSVIYDGNVDVGKTMYDLIPTLGRATKYAGQFQVIDGKLVFQGSDTKQQDWAREVGIEVLNLNGEPTVTIIPPMETVVSSGTDIIYTIKFSSNAALTTIDLTDKVEVLDDMGVTLVTQPVITIGEISGTSDDAIRQVDVTIKTDTLANGEYKLKVKSETVTNANDLTNTKDTISAIGFELIDNIPLENPTISVDPSTWTNGNITATITYPVEAVTKQYSLDGTTWNVYTSPITITDDTTIYAKGIDVLGNQTSQATLTVANIDKVSPTVIYGTNGGTNQIQISTTVTVSDTSEDGNESGVDTSTLQYVWDTQNVTSPSNGWAAFENGATLTKIGDGIYYLWVKAVDNAGNSVVSKSNQFKIDVLALTAPQIVPNITQNTSGPITVAITYSPDSVENKYMIDDGQWQDYTGPITISQNCTIVATVKDSLSNITASSLTIMNIVGEVDAEAIQKVVPDGWIGIYNSAQLFAVSNDLTKKYILMKSIDLGVSPYNTGTGWNPLGNSTTKFTGQFDGNGLKVKNLYVNKTTTYNGLFGYTSGATISNLTLENVNVIGGQYTGGLVGYNKLTTINNSSVNGIVKGTLTTTNYIGGAIGYNNSSTLTGMGANVTVTGAVNTGGLAGYSVNANIANSSSTGSVTGTTGVGGLIGSNVNNVNSRNITNTYSTAIVIGTTNVGGLIGSNTNNSAGLLNITNIYATGDVTGTTDNIGGLIGYDYNYGNTATLITTINKAYASGDVKSTAGNYVGGLIGLHDYGASNNEKITNAYAIGSTTGAGYVAGLIGSATYIDISNTYAIGKVTGSSNTGGLVGKATSSIAANSYWNVSTTLMQTSSLGTSSNIQNMIHKNSSYNSWDFSTVWDIQEGATVAYLRGMPVPDGVYISGMNYASFDGGDGSVANPYLISKESQLNNVRLELGANYKLVSDITMTSYQTGTGWTPIGTSTLMFNGSLDGDGHKISNLYINKTTEYNGLFGYTSTGTIKNLTLDNVNITGAAYTGGLVGYNVSTTISNSSINGVVKGNVNTINYIGGAIGFNTGVINGIQVNVAVTGANYVGGLTGYNANSDISNSSSIGNVTGTVRTGGLIGYNTNANITTSSTAGNITGTSYVGGLVGYNYNTVNSKNITNAYSTASVTGELDVGGLIGYNRNNSGGTLNIANVYATGNVTGTTDNIGGLIGYDYSYGNSATFITTINNAYASGAVKSTGGNYVGGLIGLHGYASTNKEKINNVYAIGTVTGVSYVAGLIGSMSYVDLTNAYAIGKVTGTNNMGGLVATATSSTATNSYWSAATTSIQTSAVGTSTNISSMLHKSSSYNNWDFTTIWDIQEGVTLAYLRGMTIPDGVYASEIDYTEFDGGDGTLANPYLISKESQLNNVRLELAANYKLVSDITITSYQTGEGWTPLGDTTTKFTGSLNGDGHKIKNLYINKTTTYNGLFGYTSGGSITNLTLENVNITGGQYTGGLIGYNALTTINNLNINGTIKGTLATTTYIAGAIGYNTGALNGINTNVTVTGAGYVGGLIAYNKGSISGINSVNGNITGTSNAGGAIGYNNAATVTGIGTNVNITGTGNTGGLIGYSTNANVSNSSSKGTVTGGSAAGGLIGAYVNNVNPKSITNVYSDSTVTGTTNVGGLIGSNTNNSSGLLNIINVYATGNVTGTTDNIGGLIGYDYNYGNTAILTTTIEKAYASGDVKSTTGKYVGGLIGFHDYAATDREKINNVYAIGNITGSSYVAGLIGRIAYVDITNAYAIGKVTGASNIGGLVALSTNSTATNSYWSVPTTTIQTSAVGTASNISSMLNKSSSYSGWDFTTIWDIQEGSTLAYLRGMTVPDGVYASGIEYYTFNGGDGTISNPYLVGTEAQLNNIRFEPAANYKLVADITMTSYQTGEGWTPIGDSTLTFTGSLNGDGHKISNLYINKTTNYIGLFGYTSGGSITNLTLDNVNITGGQYTGGLVGYTIGTSISNSSVNGIVKGTLATTSYIGGLIGYNSGVVTGTQTNVNVTGASYVGGLIAYNTNANLSNSSSTGSVNGTTNVGGSIGYNYNNANSKSIINVYATGNVSGTAEVGGLIGYNENDSGGTLNITNVYATGSVTGTVNNIGGLIGHDHCYGNSATYITTIDKAYASGDVSSSGGSYIGGLIGLHDNDSTYKEKINNVYSIGSATGVSYVAGLVGSMSYVDITNSYAIGKVTGTSNTGGLISTATSSTATNSYWSVPTTSMQTSALGTASNIPSMTSKSSSYNGWDFTTIWDIQEGQTTAYLRGMPVPDGVYTSGIDYTAFDGGDGSVANPYLISTEVQLNNIRLELAANYKLIADVTMTSYQTGAGWTPIGDATLMFTGTLNGDGHKIKNLYINKTTDYSGLFGYTSGATITNLTLDNVNITGGTYTGGLVGYNILTAISNSSINGIVKGTLTTTNYIAGAIGYNTGVLNGIQTNVTVTGASYVGGVIGYNLNGNISNSSSIGNVTGTARTGGLTGYSSNANITICSTSGNITGTTYVGGLIGYNNNGVNSRSITNTYSTATLNGTSYVGGLIGYNRNYSGGALNITSVYATGNVTGTSNYIGGLIGYDYTYGSTAALITTIDKVYASGDVKSTAGSYVGGLIGSHIYNTSYTNKSRISNSYATGDVTGATYVAGLIGELSYLDVTNSYAIGKITGTTTLGGLVAATTGSTATNSYWSVPTTTMQTSALGTASNISSMLHQSWSYNGWDFTTIWDIQEGSTIAYLRGMAVPDAVYASSIEYCVYDGGDGSVANPYLISTETQLNNMRTELGANYKLVADITMTSYQTGTGWTPIGDSTSIFTGYLNGDGHKISNLYINKTTDYNGLFGYTSGGTITNLILENVNITGGQYTGGLVGYNSTATINNVSINGTVKGILTTTSYIGGLIGYNTGSLTNITSNVTITGASYLGGITGYNTATLIGVVSNVNITGTTNVGGLTGYNLSANIVSSNSNGSVTGTAQTGGIIGYNNNTASLRSISNTYSTATVSGTTNVGGLIGYNRNYSGGAQNITSVYATGNVTGTTDNIGGLIGNDYNYGSTSALITTIDKAYASGNVISTGGNYVGGLIGLHDYNTSYTNKSKLNNSFATGSVTGTTNVAGLIGGTSYLDITNSYAIGKVTGTSSMGGLVALATGSTATNSYWSVPTTLLQTSALGTASNVASMEHKSSSYSGWNFTTIWDIQEGSTVAYLREMPVPDNVYVTGMNYVSFDGGDGSVANPYLISTETQLNNVRLELASNYKLTADITMTSYQTGEGWTPIGDNSLMFTGSLNGDGHKISNLYVNRTTTYNGLFGYTSGGAISNLTLDNINITGGQYTGGLVGYSALTAISNSNINGIVKGTLSSTTYIGGAIGTNTGNVSGVATNVTVTGAGYVGGLMAYNVNANISNCNTRGTVTGTSRTGGLIGYNNNTVNSRSITNSYSTMSVNGTTYVGGLIGYNRNYSGGALNITNVYTTGNITATGNDVGGLIGYDYNYGSTAVLITTIDKTYASGNVSSPTGTYVGGLIGIHDYYTTYTNKSKLSNSYAIGNVTGGSYTGGLVGGASYLDITNAYSIGKVTGTTIPGGLVALSTGSTATNSYWNTETSLIATSALGTNLTTAQMYQASNYTGWDFTTIWNIVEGSQYPNLR